MRLMVPLAIIRAPHGVQRRGQVRALTAHMHRYGWWGRPIVGEPISVGASWRLQAWTGAHRIAAARRAGLRHVPVLTLSVPHLRSSKVRPVWGAYLYGLPAAWDDADRARFLRGAGEEVGAMALDGEVRRNRMEALFASRSRKRHR